VRFGESALQAHVLPGLVFAVPCFGRYCRPSFREWFFDLSRLTGRARGLVVGPVRVGGSQKSGGRLMVTIRSEHRPIVLCDRHQQLMLCERQ
jgi:hypothetical protein